MGDKPVPDFDWEELDRLIGEYRAKRSASRGFTVEEFAKRKGITVSAAKKAIRDLMRADIIERVGVRYNLGSDGRTKLFAVFDIKRGRNASSGVSDKGTEDSS